MAAADCSLVVSLAMFAGLAPAEQDELLREDRSVRYQTGARSSIKEPRLTASSCYCMKAKGKGQ